MYSPELMNFLLAYNEGEEKKTSKIEYKFKDGNGLKELAPVIVTIKNNY